MVQRRDVCLGGGDVLFVVCFAASVCVRMKIIVFTETLFYSVQFLVVCTLHALSSGRREPGSAIRH